MKKNSGASRARTRQRRRRNRRIPSAADLPAIEELRGYDQWVCWRGEERAGGKTSKVPCRPDGGSASSTDERTWSSFDEALQAASENASLEGIGFVLAAADPYVGVDLDDCIDEEGEVADWAGATLELLDSYTEISPSGQGLRIFVRGELPNGGRRSGRTEIYSEKRFLTVTGRHLEPSAQGSRT